MTARLAVVVGMLVLWLAVPASAAPGARSVARARARPTGVPRTVEATHIEGEIPVPQVLFITARDQRRFVDFQHHRYLNTCLELGEQTAFPSRIAVVGNRPVEARKEIDR
ncbi:MAG: hypothetical protein E6K78_05410 [Candidatus Eisenbacteria bacterium]|uniref:Uncharacterized protein n=1 Tax=Eiseniibacteriota bacterium TaxID=2212470 RepID=A0A538TUB0_UNCEI|nr:MAG: hypothetical protein E6K78_05410 [Candidatus Eisenbacteria bacterium]